MPVFEVELGGKTFEVEADDDKAATAIAASELRADNLADQIEAVQGESGAMDLFQNQAMAGLADKASGLVGGIKGMVSGEGFGQGFETYRRAQEILEERARQRSGWAGTAAEIGGAVTTGFTGLAAKAPAAAGALGRIGQAISQGGALGGLHGAGESEARTLPGFAGDVATGAGIGATAGGALGVGAEGVKAGIRGARAITRSIGSMFDDTAGQAGRKVASALADDAVTPAQAAARMGRRNTALLNVGDENIQGLARATSAQPGPGRTMVNRALDAQQAQQGNRVMRAVTEALGGADQTYSRRVADMVAKRSAAAQRQYGKAFARNFGKDHSPKFDALARRVPGEAVRNAQRVAQAEGRPFGQQLVASIDDAGNVTFRRAPSLEEWHYIQRGLRSATDTAYRQGAGEVGTAYRNLHREILSAMDEASPIYRNTRKMYADESAQLDALQFGREILRPSNTRNADQIADDIATMSAPEKEMVRIGFARQLQDLAESTPDGGNVVRRIFGTPAKRNAIRAAFPSDSAFRKFRANMSMLAKEAGNYSAIRQGSRTAFVDAERQGFDALGAIADAATGSPVNTTVRGVAGLLRSMGRMDDRVAAEVAKILVERDPQAVMRALSPAMNRQASQAARSELLRQAGMILRQSGIGATGAAGGRGRGAMGF